MARPGYEPDTLVWVKLRGFPWWPSRVRLFSLPTLPPACMHAWDIASAPDSGGFVLCTVRLKCMMTQVVDEAKAPENVVEKKPPNAVMLVEFFEHMSLYVLALAINARALVPTSNCCQLSHTHN